MAEFHADLRDIKFALFEQSDFASLLGTAKFKELDRDTIEAVIDEAYKLAKNQMAPINEDADRIGTTFDAKTGSVTMPKSFHEVYKTYADNGWLSLHHSPEYGGQGMPVTMHLVSHDIFFGACLSFSLNAILTTGAGHLIETFGTDELKRRFVEKMYRGEWAGTMCLTEAQAGSDVGAVRTKAKREGDHFVIEGEKIFISAGEHDMAANIIHPVLARIEGAPAGTKGISLFVVPKIRVKPDGSLGEANDVKCTGIEHKMGIHGSPTCTMVFGAEGKCHGYLLGEQHPAMAEMFQMMNDARILVGLQGSALANAAYQFARRYAEERIQGKDIFNRDPGAPSVPIIRHPDVRQMLMWQKAYAEGLRALLIRTAVFSDRAACTDDTAERERLEGLVELLTPVCKAYGSDVGFRSVELSLQTLGGYGYIGEYPVEQYLRDTKIASIYEGTNGIQALDLVGRKLPARDGANLMALAMMLNELIDKHTSHPVLGASMQKLAEARDALADVSLYFAKMGRKDPLVPVLNATPYLDLFGQVAVGWMLLEQASIAYPKLTAIAAAKGVKMDDAKALSALVGDNEDAKFFDGKVKVAQFYAARALPLCRAKADVLKAGDKTPMEMTF